MTESKKIRKVWYSGHSKASFSIQALHPESGKPEWAKYRDGAMKYKSNGEPVPIMASYVFETVSKQPGKECSIFEVVSDDKGEFSLTQQRMIERLDSEDVKPSIMTEDEWKRSKNYEAWQKGLEFENYKSEKEKELEKIKDENKTQNKVIEMQRKKIAELEKTTKDSK